MDAQPNSPLATSPHYGTLFGEMTYEQLPDEWKEWVDLTPLERFRRSELIFAQYLAMGGMP